MYLSRVELDTTRRATMVALANPQKIHGAIEASYPGERQRRLWRVDTLGGRTYLLVLSDVAPDLSDVARQYGPVGADPGYETRDYDPLLQRATDDSIWHFRLVANPVINRSNGSTGGRGHVMAHSSVQYQEQWLRDRADKNGFRICENTLVVTGSKWYRFTKNGAGKPVSLLAVTYEGTLQVTDADRFRQMLCQGIGRGKAYGLGFLTIVHAGGNHG